MATPPLAAATSGTAVTSTGSGGSTGGSSSESLTSLGQRVRSSARRLAACSITQRNTALQAIAEALERDADAIVAANAEDCKAAAADGISKVLQSRLKLDREKLQAAITGVRQVMSLSDPLGVPTIHRELDRGLVLKRLTVPLGVVGIIFEARPEALIQITSLAIKSGNGIILKGGKEAVRSCTQLTKTIQSALASTSVVSADVVALLTTREEIQGLLKLDQYVDLIIPRGSNDLVRYVQNNTRIPVLGHADGICHLFIDVTANLELALAVLIDSKTQYASACNAVETLLVHRDVHITLLPKLVRALQDAKVEVRGDERTVTACTEAKIVGVLPATEKDWATEYCDFIISVRVVDTLDDAINHINTYGSRHTDGIISEDAKSVETFFSQVDAAGVFHNCSTRFADGFRYGFGAEVGISTQKMPPRGPVGLEGLVTYKYHLVGNGQTVASYSGANATHHFTHRDLPLVASPPSSSL